MGDPGHHPGASGGGLRKSQPHVPCGGVCLEPHTVTEDGGPSREVSEALSGLGRGEGGILQARKVVSVG